ncbi:hypothetical protein PWT90_03258 [Aphanocladium album]|nr:hypothetical protein PWT90_03258 [Aphanocladium album]
MHPLTSYIFLAIFGVLAAAAPWGLPIGLISQHPNNYNTNHADSGRSGAPEKPPAHGDLDPDDDNEVDIIPGDLFEGDSDSGGESNVGNDAVSVANGFLGSGGAGSAALNNQTSGSTTVFCSLFACASAAQSDGKVSTSATGAKIHASGSLISIKGPLVVIQAPRTSVRKTSS